MDNIFKIVGIRFPNYYDKKANRHLKPTVVTVSDKTKIKHEIENMLFDDDIYVRKSQVLVKWDGKMYICDPINIEKKTFTKAEIQFHPYQELA